MPTYKVKTRFFKQGKVTHKKGDIIESDKDLMKAFPNGFDLVDSGPTVKKAKKPKVKIVDDDDDDEEEEKVVRKKRKKIKAGA